MQGFHIEEVSFPMREYLLTIIWLITINLKFLIIWDALQVDEEEQFQIVNFKGH
jgi:hypothetical protein